MALGKGETPEQYIAECLGMIESCQEMINTLQESVLKHPDLAQEIGMAIRDEKSIINIYRKEIEECTT